jgi:hypothetical protein
MATTKKLYRVTNMGEGIQRADLLLTPTEVKTLERVMDALEEGTSERWAPSLGLEKLED